MKKYIFCILLLCLTVGCGTTINNKEIEIGTQETINNTFIDILKQNCMYTPYVDEIYVDDTTVVIKVNFDEHKSIEDTKKEALNVASTLLNTIVCLPTEYYDNWDQIYIDFGKNIGTITKTKANITDNYIEVTEKDLI